MKLIFSKWKLWNNKTIIRAVSMIKNSESAGNRKKVEEYSYCLSHNIGKGYSSQVFKGRNDNSNEIVAIKVIDMRLLKGEVHKNLLESEIDVLKCLKNARNIVEVFDIYTTKNNTYIMTEFCEGGDLSKLISTRRGMPEKEAIVYLKQIVDGYSEISSNRIIHRDLKPANILLKENKIKIADFGFAMKSSDSKKQSSYNVGSPIYMPPEALNENKYSFKSDVWAIGVIYFELLTGKTPWRAKTEKELGRQLLSVPISKMLPTNLSETSIEFLLKTLSVDYEKRMNPEELERYMSRFDFESSVGSNIEHIQTCQSFKTNSTGITGTQCSIRGTQEDEEVPKMHETSLNKNQTNLPKNMGRFGFLKGQEIHNGTLKEINNTSLPKTVKTAGNNKSEKTLDAEEIRKKISKELLSQVHFCRFVFKLFQRIEIRIEGEINPELKSSMCGLVFQRLEDIEELRCVNSGFADYKKSNDYKKLCQIVSQYQEKYRKELGPIETIWKGFDKFEIELSKEIKKLFDDVKSSVLEENQQKVIILDYLITLRQLSNLLSKNSIEVFHEKSKIEAIVEGSPAKSITSEHLVAITSKLKTIKLI